METVDREGRLPRRRVDILQPHAGKTGEQAGEGFLAFDQG
jgi:hypothetical protein